MKCSIVKDLLSNYIDGLCSEETVAEIQAHLDECRECSSVYEKMSKELLPDVPPTTAEINFLKKLRARIRRKNMIVAICTCIVVLTGFFIFSRNYELPLPFDTYRMSVELFPSVAVTHKDGSISWENLDRAIAKGIEIDEDAHQLNVLQRVYRGINGVMECSTGRVVNRAGQEVRVVYYCYMKTLWDSLFVDPDLQEYSESGTSTGTDMYGDSYESKDYEPHQMIEVYYLPMRNLNKIDTLPDEEYDRLRENCMLVWSGVI